MIEVAHLEKHYRVDGRSVRALDDINLSIAEGEVFGIIGRSGAGKSTLIRCLNLLERPDTGRVALDGVDLTTLDARALQHARRRIGMVFQHFNLLTSRTVAGNIRFPLELAGELDKAAMDARVNELIELVGLSGFGDSYPSQLSGGQKQRVGIARALASHPAVLLCDEATSALDPETTDAILALLLDINRRLKLTIVLITHEMRVIRNLCDRVAVIEGGRIVESGTVIDVFLHPRHDATRKLLAETGFYQEASQQAWRAHVAGPLLKLTFVGPATLTPVLDEVSREHRVNFNLVNGTLADIKGTPFGQLLVGVVKSDIPLADLQTVFHEKGVDCEVLP
ncbi:methionine import ATP-binding protein MetN 2 [Paludibacterium paludis]|uniref:Methionine import ATP-binding protein MetN 2 n=1 Tax=Paludibacterium paludis TaxID=1225769 RepID=A0A918NWF7_9NEIS|nr:ATP-binding cassette domain-containing protein [Paludibacterium paludis]GGY02353.1 methionine import ATP-binding protein MetN 2 [Paludibacterium paludis]